VLDLHRGFVKGVCWDPVGEFLATASDDRSVKIWRTSDWGLEAEVEKPFEASPGTFFRRLRYVALSFWIKTLTMCSWSPDGAHITASNATNNQGFVFIAAVIARNSWTSEISLVGHENTVEVSVCGSVPIRWLPALTFPVLQPSYICAQRIATRCHVKYMFRCGPRW
jgi:protein HIRA/HIR1